MGLLRSNMYGHSSWSRSLTASLPCAPLTSASLQAYLLQVGLKLRGETC